MNIRTLAYVLGILLVSRNALALTRLETLYERAPDAARRAVPRVGYQFRFYSSTDDENAAITNFGLQGHEVVSSIPVYRANDFVVTIAPEVGYLKVKTDADLPGGATAFPFELYNFSAGLHILREIPGTATYGVSIEPGSAADKPFNSDTWTLDATISYRPWSGRLPGNLIWFVDYSNNRLFLNGLPAPGFAYTFSPRPWLKVVAGLPVLAVDARLGEEWNARFRFYPTKILQGEAVYRLSSNEFLVAGYRWDFDSYLPVERADPGDRLVLSEQSAFVDLMARVLPQLTVRAGGGFAFGRSLYQASNFYDVAPGEIFLKPTLVASVKVSVELF